MDIQLTRRFRIGFDRYGKCWRFRFSKNTYYAGRMRIYSFWRFYFVVED